MRSLFRLLIVLGLVGCVDVAHTQPPISPNSTNPSTTLPNRSPSVRTTALPNKTPERANQITIRRCLISAIDDVSVPAQEAGVLAAIHAREGETVTPDQEKPLAQIDDRDSQIKRKAAMIEVEMAKIQAESDVKVRIAKKTAAVAKAEYDKSLEINKRSPGAVPETEIRRQYLTYERQELEAEYSTMELDVAAKTRDAKAEAVAAADNDIRKRRIESPVVGVVDKVLKRKGEWVTPGEQVFRVVRVDRVRVEGFLSYSEVSPGDVNGQPVKVEIQLRRRGREPVIKTVPGIIEFVSPVIEGGEFRVWAEVENEKLADDQWLLHPGAYADMHVELKTVAGK